MTRDDETADNVVNFGHFHARSARWIPDGYRIDGTGLYVTSTEDPTGAVRIAGPLEVVAETRRADGRQWGVLLRWWDRDGAERETIVRREDLMAGGGSVCRRLADSGFWIAPGAKARTALISFLSAIAVPERATLVSAPGWHGEAYVLPDETIGPDDGERVILDVDGLALPPTDVAGEVARWRREVASLAIGNSRIALALSAALAPPLLAPLGLEGGGVHFRGASSTGKSTLLAAAASVWGPPGFMASWRATANGLESVAAGRNDALLVLDELGQVSGREACEAAYMLANGEGKARAGRHGEGETRRTWRTLFISSGEIGLAEKARQANQRLMAGQAVRVLDVPVDAGAGLGAFEALHGHGDADTFARHLKRAAVVDYGHAARRFVQALARDRDRMTTTARQHVDAFVDDHVPQGADGQVARAVQRFGVIAAAGELATDEDILPWSAGEATRAAAAAFQAWCDARGGGGYRECGPGQVRWRRLL